MFPYSPLRSIAICSLGHNYCPHRSQQDSHRQPETGRVRKNSFRQPPVREEKFVQPSGAGSLSEEAVNVYRTASRIDLEQISVSWSGDNAADLKEAKARFHLKRIYVIDAKNATCLADHSSTDASVELTGVYWETLYPVPNSWLPA